MLHATAVPAPRAASAPAVLEAEGLVLDYPTDRGTVRAVEDVGFTVRQGERLVLIGASGCGKSSILRMVAGFQRPTAGTIRTRGKPVTGPSPERIVVFQEFDQLLPWKTVAQNVMFPLRVARRLSTEEARERAVAALGKVGLERAIDAYPHTLSGA